MCVLVKTLKPVFLRPPNDQTVTEDDECGFEAVVTGKPEPVVQWLVLLSRMCKLKAIRQSDKSCRNVLSQLNFVRDLEAIAHFRPKRKDNI